MSVRRSIESSEEVRIWYAGLTPTSKAPTDRVFERFVLQDNMPHMPHSRPLGDGLHGLRFSCKNVNRRITYVFDPGHRVVALTTFRKQHQNE